ncbi:CtIP- endonuclease [Metarhizium acridum]|nr:CtIP- endonuclease [Metarhizium acridum]
MSKLQDSSISIPVMSLPLKKHKHKNQNTSLAISLLSGATAGATEATPSVLQKHMPVRRYKNGHALRVTITEQGVAEVYRGLASTTIKQSATSEFAWEQINSLKETASPRLGAYGNHLVATFGLTRDQGAMGTTVSVAVRDIFLDGGRESVLER